MATSKVLECPHCGNNINEEPTSEYLWDKLGIKGCFEQQDLDGVKYLTPENNGELETLMICQIRKGTFSPFMRACYDYLCELGNHVDLQPRMCRGEWFIRVAYPSDPARFRKIFKLSWETHLRINENQAQDIPSEIKLEREANIIWEGLSQGQERKARGFHQFQQMVENCMTRPDYYMKNFCRVNATHFES